MPAGVAVAQAKTFYFPTGRWIPISAALQREIAEARARLGLQDLSQSPPQAKRPRSIRIVSRDEETARILARHSLVEALATGTKHYRYTDIDGNLRVDDLPSTFWRKAAIAWSKESARLRTETEIPPPGPEWFTGVSVQYTYVNQIEVFWPDPASGAIEAEAPVEAPEPAANPPATPAELSATTIEGTSEHADRTEIAQQLRGDGQKRKHTSPKTERVAAVLRDLFPNGIPSQSELTNPELCKKVGAKVSGVSDKTILRAAGRSK